MGLTFSFTGFQILYSLLVIFLWTLAFLFSLEYMKQYSNKKRYYSSLFATLIATVCMFLANDLYTLFLFFEIISFTSYVWVIFDKKKESLIAGKTYLAVAIIGGMVMLMGIFLLYYLCNTLNFQKLRECSVVLLTQGGRNASLFSTACYLLFVGFGAKAGVFPLHIWLPKAHPVAPAPASALLSGILTKTGIFGILIINCYLMVGEFHFFHFLIIIGTITMLLGGFFGILSVDLKKTIAYSSVSQIGFLLLGIAMMGLLQKENAMAARGTFLHMMNHSVWKLTLFMAAGVVFMNTHELNLNKIRGFGRNKPLFHVIFLCGAMGISGVPGFNGYISKSLLHESILEGCKEFSYLAVVEKLFLLAGGMTVCYMLKLYIAIFVEKNSDLALQQIYDEAKTGYMNSLSKLALTMSALMIPILGLSPHVTMDLIANQAVYFMNSEMIVQPLPYFTIENLKGSFLSVFIGLLLYGVVRRILNYANVLPKFINLETAFYVPLMEKSFLFFKIIARIMDGFLDEVIVFLRKTIYRDSPLPHELEEGNFLTHILGIFLETVQSTMNKTIHKKHPTYVKFEHQLAKGYEWMRQTNDLIARTMSFGLIIFLAGFIFTLLYLLRTVHF